MNEIMNITEVVTMTSLEIVNLINKFREEEGCERAYKASAK